MAGSSQTVFVLDFGAQYGQLIARRVREATKDVRVPMKVAVMGCIVNGPGEAKEADLGLAGAKNFCKLFSKGQEISTITGDPVDALVAEIRRRAEEFR